MSDPDGDGLLAAWTRIPLAARIGAGLALGVAIGLALWSGSLDAAGGLPPVDARPGWVRGALHALDTVAAVLLRLLNAIAPPLVFVAAVRALLGAELERGTAGRLLRLLALNTFVAVGVGLLVANVLQPGAHARVEASSDAPAKALDFLKLFVDQIPRDVLSPFVNQPPAIHVNPIGAILVAIAVGAAGRGLPEAQRALLRDGVELAFALTVRVLHAVVQLVPFAGLAKVGALLGERGVQPFVALGHFVAAVLLALALQVGWYLARVRAGSWVRPARLLAGARDALVMAFSTASSTATMPVTYECLVEKVGVRPRSASLGALVGANFNNDGTALYEAMSALFVAQLTGVTLSLGEQVVVVLTSVVAGCGAAGIPEAGLVTMTLVFEAVGLPVAYVAVLLPVDWFLDRCRTAVNVMGDLNVSCLLDGPTPPDR